MADWKIQRMDKNERLDIDNVSGTFQVDEIITGANSGATATVKVVQATYLEILGRSITNFENNEEIEGGTSSATADVDNPEGAVGFGAGLHTFEVTPEVLPGFEYQQLVTDHVLLSGDLKQDKATKIVKSILIRWPRSSFISTTERELLEVWAKLTCLFKLTWTDDEAASKNKTGYLMLDNAAAVEHAGYQFGLRLRFSE